MAFFSRRGPFPLSTLFEAVGGELIADDDPEISDVSTLAEAGAGDIVVYSNVAYRKDLAGTQAGAIITHARFANDLPEGRNAIICPDPGVAFDRIVAIFYPDAGVPKPVHGTVGVSTGAHLHDTAVVEDGVFVEPGASVGAGARIGRGTRIHSTAVIGAHVTVGRNCSIGPGASILHAHIGDRVILHPGVRIGQDGFGYSAGPRGLQKSFQVGKVIIQDDVEIGANSCVDRGGVRDTIVGEGTKIDNLVQIAHNVVIGRSCVLVSLTALAGSVTLGDGVQIGGGSVINNHVTLASGVRIAGASAVKDDIYEAGDWMGRPALPAREWIKSNSAQARIVAEWTEQKRQERRAHREETND